MVTQEDNVIISEEPTTPAMNNAETDDVETNSVEVMGVEATLLDQENKATNGNAPSVNGDSPKDSEQSGPTEADQVAALQAELQSAQAKADDLLDKLQRTVAEAQNSRR